jgi:hypothetical protein
MRRFAECPPHPWPSCSALVMAIAAEHIELLKPAPKPQLRGSFND